MNTHTPGPWRQGITLSTQRTRRWTQEQWDANEKHEKRLIFAEFHVDDEGTSRQIVAECRRPEDAEYIVRACNAYHAMLEALEYLMRSYNEASRNSGDAWGEVDWSVFDKARDAIADARGKEVS